MFKNHNAAKFWIDELTLPILVSQGSLSYYYYPIVSIKLVTE